MVNDEIASSVNRPNDSSTLSSTGRGQIRFGCLSDSAETPRLSSIHSVEDAAQSGPGAVPRSRAACPA